MVGNKVTTAIITRGLTCDPSGTACTNGIITTFFGLYCGIEIVSTGGGSYPKDAWNKFNPGEFKNFWKIFPDKQQYFVVPRDQEEKYFSRYKVIKIVIRLGDHRIEKEYSVPEKHVKQIFKIMNIVNVTKQSIKITIENVRHLSSNAIITIKRLRLKK